MLSCEQLVRRADELLDARPGWRERLVLKLHLWMCPPCATFARQYRRLLGISERLEITDEVSAAEVERVMRAIDNAMKSPS